MNIRNVSFRSICEIVNLCSNETLLDKNHIKRLFQKYSLYFEDNLEFALKLGFIKEQDNKLILAKKGRNDEQSLKDTAITSVLKNREKYNEFWRYLDSFELIDNILVFYPKISETLKHAKSRDFLCEIGLVNITDNTHYISPLYIQEVMKKKIITPKMLRIMNQKKEQIGLKAELFILSYEKKLLKSFTNLKENVTIKHIAKTNVNAGYDIESFDRKCAELGQFKKIYIEVKAVNANDFKFYWSKNEIESAALFKNDYYLYLLPVKSDATFDINKLVIINDPHENIINNKEWIKTNEIISVRRGVSHE